MLLAILRKPVLHPGNFAFLRAAPQKAKAEGNGKAHRWDSVIGSGHWPGFQQVEGKSLARDAGSGRLRAIRRKPGAARKHKPACIFAP
jgi:hypothetical protein